jgi:Signal transduction histidine kinase
LGDIDSLLQEKNIIVNRLIRQFRTQNPLIELDKKIETYDDIIQDSIVVTTNQDTTLVEKRQKDFWGRLRNLFDPKYAPDTTITIVHTEQEARSTSRVDTIMYADLKNITQEASRTYSSQIERIERQVRQLVFAEQNISLRISQLITQFYNEALQTTRQGIDNSEMLTQKIFTFSLIVGALSILLILIIIFFIIDDLNKGQKARSDLAKEKQLTEDLIDSRHKLLLSVSHDIKTPLSSIMGYMEMWDSEDATEDRKRQLQSAQNSGKHILSMLTNLLEFSRLERNSGTLYFSRFNLIEMMEDIVNMFQPFTEEKGLALEFENHAPSPFFVETDYTLLKQILVNVISNAVKYTPQGSVCIRLQQEQQLVFTITDTGIGMDADDIQKIFTPFSRIKNPVKTEGSGFGMYVTKGLVDTLKGSIVLTSEKGKGTCVTVKLPIRQRESISPPEKKEDSEREGRRYNKVLLFEDDVSLGAMMKEFLTQKGYKVKLCSDSRDIKGFLRLISLFDIVLTDMQMTNITGTDILHEIRKTDSGIPIWLMTAHGEYTTERAVSEGFTGLITKPIQMHKLIETISREGFRGSEEKSRVSEEMLGDAGEESYVAEKGTHEKRVPVSEEETHASEEQPHVFDKESPISDKQSDTSDKEHPISDKKSNASSDKKSHISDKQPYIPEAQNQVSRKKPQGKRELSLQEKFPKLASLFGDDEKAVKSILVGFAQSSYKDREALTEIIKKGEFKEAQQLCHRMYPFFSQLDADHLCGTLRKMDSLRGEEESSYPDWKEDLTETIAQIKEFADGIRKEYL